MIQKINSSNMGIDETIIVTVFTPKGESIMINIIMPRKRQLTINQDSTELIAELTTIAGKMPIYKLPEEEYLIGYTVNDYGLLVGSKKEMINITRNNNYNTISLIKKKDSFYYGFEIFSSLIEDMLRKEYVVLVGFETNFYLPPSYGGVLQFKAIQFKDKSILHYLESAPGVYQGMWFPDINHFTFFFENQYTG